LLIADGTTPGLAMELALPALSRLARDARGQRRTPRRETAAVLTNGRGTRWLWVLLTAALGRDQPDGRVQATAVDQAGQPLVARDLIACAGPALVRMTTLPKCGSGFDGGGFDHRWQDTLHQMFQGGPSEVRTQFKDARTLVIVPHHICIISRLPPSSRNRMRRGKALGQRVSSSTNRAIVYAVAGSVDMLRRRPDRPMTQVAGLGLANLPKMPHLPGVEIELRALQDEFGSLVKPVLTGNAAHKENLLTLLREPGFLLVGTHGQNWPDRPLESEIYLQPRGGDNGRLTAGELYGSEVGRDLTVLSACYTALADKSPSRGRLVRFATLAVVRRTDGVAGQWDIYDQTGPG
jgi:hypothetical protein